MSNSTVQKQGFYKPYILSCANKTQEALLHMTVCILGSRGKLRNYYFHGEMMKKVDWIQWSALWVLSNPPNLKSSKCRAYTTRQKIMFLETLPKHEFYVKTDDTECKTPPFPAIYQLKRFKRIWGSFYLPALQKRMMQSQCPSWDWEQKLIFLFRARGHTEQFVINALWFGCCRGKLHKIIPK